MVELGASEPCVPSSRAAESLEFTRRQQPCHVTRAIAGDGPSNWTFFSQNAQGLDFREGPLGGSTSGKVLLGGSTSGKVLLGGSTSGKVLLGGSTSGKVLLGGSTSGKVLLAAPALFSWY